MDTRRARRWLAAVGCGAVAAGAATAAGPAAPAKLPDAIPQGGPAPAAVVVTTTAVPPPPGMPGCEECGGSCAAGSCKNKHAQRKEERKVIRAGVTSCAHTPALFVPAVGTFTREAFETQRVNALAEYFVVFREEWLAGTADLNATGERHLAGVVRRLGGVPHPVKIEPTGVATLDELRRAAVAQALVRAGVDPTAALNRVVVGGTRAEGLRYEEIETVYLRSDWGRVGGGGFGGGNTGGIGGGFGGFGR